MKALWAAVCDFLAMFGFTWLMCMRASDWGTERWATGTRWMKLVGGAVACLFLFIALANALYPEKSLQTDFSSIFLGAGVLLGIVFYALAAYFRPGMLGAQRMAPSLPVHVPNRLPRSAGEWLLLDVRALPKLFNRDRRTSNRS